MPKYLIERTYDVGEDELPAVATRSKRIAVEQFPEIVWLHSHVVADSDGTLKSFCVYQAPDEEMVRRHAELLGNHVVDHVYEIGGDVTPDDFPL
ncbi:MAG: nickel-binding protein [Candidatus Dormiibacterota bacterium]